MYGGDHARKSVLIEYGFRLPAASDNRPLTFDEFNSITGQKAMSAPRLPTMNWNAPTALWSNRLCGLQDCWILRLRCVRRRIRLTTLSKKIRKRAEKDERVLVTTLTKRMAKELPTTLTRLTSACATSIPTWTPPNVSKIIEDFKNGLFDVLVGVNLLREGLDIPTVSLVAILDADKEGFLRSGRALTQTAGRAARNVNGLVIMYADTVTDSMEQTIRETDRRRTKQIEYNKLHHITPKQVEVKRNILVSELYGEPEKAVNPRVKNGPSGRVSAPDSVSIPTYIPNPSDLGRGSVSVGLGHDSKREGNTAYVDGFVRADLAAVLQDPVIRSMSREQIQKTIAEDKRRMEKSAADLDFNEAARYRDEMWALQEYLKVWKD